MQQFDGDSGEVLLQDSPQWKEEDVLQKGNIPEFLPLKRLHQLYEAFTNANTKRHHLIA